MTAQRTSSIPYVKAALVDLCTKQLSSEGPQNGPVQVTYGDVRDWQREYVRIGDVTQPEQQTWAQLGARQREEQYLLDVAVYAGGPDFKTQQDATGRAFELLGFVETGLRADVQLGLAGSDTGQFTYMLVEVGTIQLEEWPHADRQGFCALVSWTLRVTTRM